MKFVYNNFECRVDNPSQCPHCHNGIEPRHISQNIEQGINYSVWKCTFRECGKQFIAVHQVIGQGQAKFVGFLDGQPIGPYWPETIKKLKSKFIETYNQSLKAEYSGLDEIAGMGFRKAIEYLVKDYLIQRDSSLEGKIEDKLLASVIGENFSTPQEADLKDLLQRATWLGNDMTHYLRYHDNFDINDLKELIQLVMDEIHSIEQKRHYIANIQSKYKK
ncbi:DUF4145 domain-containing protein [Albibacterium bauzanense]|uniref:Uncharacterized protein DUF4145 n=1 Tax=Albibacterium bauzanense TaxID=653929 RepID=A0A4R1LY32_9SPHI|nr:DUF4145 domain-containing protein [Albibacterium bauzanense]TCK83490.1 uncharacterized protein DUF4145 [Albibacterium bauzanense]